MTPGYAWQYSFVIIIFIISNKLFQIIFLEFLDFPKKKYSEIPFKNEKLQQGVFTESNDLIIMGDDKFHLFAYTNNDELVHKATYNIDSCENLKIHVISDKLLISNNGKLISQWNIKTRSYEDTCYLLLDYARSFTDSVDTKFSSN